MVNHEPLTDGFFSPNPREQAETWAAMQMHRERRRYLPRNCKEFSLWWQKRVTMPSSQGPIGVQVRNAWATYLDIENTYPLWLRGKWLDVQYQKYCTTMPFLRVDPERIHAEYYAMGAIDQGKILLVGYATREQLQDGVYERIGGRQVYGLHADQLCSPKALKGEGDKRV